MSQEQMKIVKFADSTRSLDQLRVDAKIIDVGVRQAKQWLEHLIPQYQRKLNPVRVAQYKSLLASGEFGAGRVAIVAVPNSQESMRLSNGQHILTALCELGKHANLLCFVEWFRCDNEAEYNQVFHSVDVENHNRTQRELVASYKATGQIATDAPASFLNAFRGGVEMAIMAGHLPLPEGWTSRWDLRRESKLHRLGLLQKYSKSANEIFTWADQMGMEAARAFMKRTPTLAVMVATLEAHRRGASQFWHETITGLYRVHDAGYPPMVLRDIITRVKLNQDLAKARHVDYLSLRDMYVTCLRCWNAWAEERTISFARRTVKHLHEIPVQCPEEGVWDSRAIVPLQYPDEPWDEPS